MALPDYTFTEGFDKYAGPNAGQVTVNNAALVNALTLGDWTVASTNAAYTYALRPALTGNGYSLFMSAGTVNAIAIYKTLPNNYARSIGGLVWSSSLTDTYVSFGDAGSAQLTLTWSGSGQLELRRGGSGGTLIATSALSFPANTAVNVEWDITFNNTTGIAKVYFNGVIDANLNLTGIDTCNTANNYFSRITSGVGSASSHIIDHLYLWCYLAAGGSETPALTNPVVQTDWAVSDYSVQFTPMKDTIGDGLQSNLTGTTNAPGANRLSLRKFTAGSSGTLDSIGLIPAATSATPKFKGVVYADNGSGTAAGTLIAVGTEVVGGTSGTTLVLPFGSPPAVTAGTIYWIGYITDVSLTVYGTNAAAQGYGAANTYASGAPGTAPALTSGLTSYTIWGNVSSPTSNWSSVSHWPYGGSLAYLQDATVGHEDLYSFPALSSSPSAVYSVAVKAVVNKTDTGVRTMDLRAKSGATTSSGSSPDQALLTTPFLYSSYYNLDPDTGVAWTPSAVNAAAYGFKLKS